MKAGKLQCKDIPTIPILRYLRENGGIGCSWLDGWERSVAYCMPPGTPGKLVHAKMRQMLHKGLVDGCDCGCRGDWRLGDRGEELLERLDGGPSSSRPGPGGPGARATIIGFDFDAPSRGTVSFSFTLGEVADDDTPGYPPPDEPDYPFGVKP